MTSHDTFLQLAAAAIDFGLAPAERRRLDAHLAECPLCARSAAAMRADALVLAGLPRVALPERRGAEILYAAMHPARVRSPLRLVAVAALLALLALGTLVVGAELVRRLDDDRLVIVPVPSASATATPSGAPTPGPTEENQSLPVDTLIAYVGVEDGRYVIRTIHPDGTGARTIAEGTKPAWSPDGTMLAFECPPAIATDEPPALDVCVAAVDGTGLRRVTTQAIAPAWSPDGTQLLFARSVIDAGDTWTVNLDGSGERWLGGGTGSWSPDGQWVLLVGASGAEPDATIVHPDGTGARQLGTCWGAAWSPDGTKLACTTLEGGDGELRAVNVADGTMGFLVTEHAQIGEPRWLTETRIVVRMSGTGSANVPDGDHLYLLDLEAGETRLLLDQAATVTSVAPGAGWFAVTVGAPGTSNVHLISIDGEDVALTSDGSSSHAAWQPRPPGTEPGPTPTPPALARLGFSAVEVGSESVAWASTSTELYRTTDGGATWASIETPVPHSPALSVATDERTLFLVAPDPSPTVWVTRDGGASWAQVFFPGDDRNLTPKLTFSTVDHGFATFATERRTLRVYETVDGGRTWTGPSVSAIPDGVLDKVQGPQNGVLWLSNGKADNEPFDPRLTLSVDGGATWQEARLPSGPEAPVDDLKWVDAIWADGAGRVVLAMSMGGGPQLYTSEDGGRSWQFVRSWSSFVSGNTTVSHRPALLSARDWVLFAEDGSGSWSTTDGGATWREVRGTATGVLDEIVVVSAERAYAVHRCDMRRSLAEDPDPLCVDPAVDTILLVTSNGGRTWTRVTG